MENSLLETLKSVWLTLFLISFGITILSFFLGFIDLFVLMRFDGKIKRGIKIWSKPLSREFRTYFSTLTDNIVETKKNWFSERKIGFIRIEGGEVLIYSRRPHWSTSWPYVGYVDLSVPEPVLQFRSSLPMHLFLLPFILSGVAIPFVAGLMIFNYYMESTAIENFLRRKINGNS